MTSLYKFRIRKTPKTQSKSVKEGSHKRDQGENKDGDPNNPFSFKEFVRKDKRKAVYYNSKEDDNDGYNPSDSEGPEDGTLKEPTRDLNDIFNDEDGSGEKIQFLDMGNQASQGSQGSSSPDGKASQRRATSSGVPNRSRGKAHRSAQSAINPVPPIPPHSHNAHPHTDFQSHPPPGSSADPVKATPIMVADVDKAARGAEFVDFIYDYATKDDDQEVPEKTMRSNTGTNMSNGPPKPADRKQGRERARAHTHGHGPRKHKTAAATTATNEMGNTKSQLVVDYMDATVNSQNLLSSSTLPSSQTSVPNLSVNNGTEVDEVGPKPGRERARAQSHGHRKKLPKKAPDPPAKKETAQSVPEIVHAVAAENGHSIYQSPRPRANGLEARPAPNKSSEILAKQNGEAKTENEVSASQPMPESVEELTTEVSRLRSNNRYLRQELVDAKKAVEKDAKKIDGMEVEMRRLRDREAEDAKTLETMVHHVEANLKRTTERAVTAENTITKLKAEIKSLKGEITALASKNKKLEEGTALQELKEKSHAASVKLATAAKEADASIKQMASGVEALKLLAETLACIDRISEVPKSFGTAL